jgi:hypothetical protein
MAETKRNQAKKISPRPKKKKIAAARTDACPASSITATNNKSNHLLLMLGVMVGE